MFKNLHSVSRSFTFVLLAAAVAGVGAACSADFDHQDEGSGAGADASAGAVDGAVDSQSPPSKPCTDATAATDCEDNKACTLDRCVRGRCEHAPNNGASCAGAGAGQSVDLKTAGDYVVLAKAAISTVPSSVITGNLGLSPAAASNATGFSLVMDASGVFSTSAQVTGNVYAADYAPGTPSKLTTAISDMELAFTDAAGRAPDFTEVGAGDIGGLTLPAGVYKWGTGLIIPTDVTLSGSATDVWIFQVAGNLVMSGSIHVTLAGAALPKNVFWQVSGLVDIGSAAHFEGVILTKTAITVKTGASVDGRLFAQTAVSLDAATITQPSP